MSCCISCSFCVQVETETADAESKLYNATQRLQRLEQDVRLLTDKSANVTQKAKLTDQEAAEIGRIAKDVKKVGSSFL